MEIPAIDETFDMVLDPEEVILLSENTFGCEDPMGSYVKPAGGGGFSLAAKGPISGEGSVTAQTVGGGFRGDWTVAQRVQHRLEKLPVRNYPFTDPVGGRNHWAEMVVGYLTDLVLGSDSHAWGQRILTDLDSWAGQQKLRARGKHSLKFDCERASQAQLAKMFKDLHAHEGFDRRDPVFLASQAFPTDRVNPQSLIRKWQYLLTATDVKPDWFGSVPVSTRDWAPMVNLLMDSALGDRLDSLRLRQWMVGADGQLLVDSFAALYIRVVSDMLEVLFGAQGLAARGDIHAESFRRGAERQMSFGSPDMGAVDDPMRASMPADMIKRMVSVEPVEEAVEGEDQQTDLMLKFTERLGYEFRHVQNKYMAVLTRQDFATWHRHGLAAMLQEYYLEEVERSEGKKPDPGQPPVDDLWGRRFLAFASRFGTRANAVRIQSPRGPDRMTRFVAMRSLYSLSRVLVGLWAPRSSIANGDAEFVAQALGPLWVGAMMAVDRVQVKAPDPADESHWSQDIPEMGGHRKLPVHQGQLEFPLWVVGEEHELRYRSLVKSAELRRKRADDAEQANQRALMRGEAATEYSPWSYVPTPAPVVLSDSQRESWPSRVPSAYGWPDNSSLDNTAREVQLHPRSTSRMQVSRSLAFDASGPTIEHLVLSHLDEIRAGPRDGSPWYYAVFAGEYRGVPVTDFVGIDWDEVSPLVTSVRGAQHKRFKLYQEAADYARFGPRFGTSKFRIPVTRADVIEEEDEEPIGKAPRETPRQVGGTRLSLAEAPPLVPRDPPPRRVLGVLPARRVPIPTFADDIDRTPAEASARVDTDPRDLQIARQSEAIEALTRMVQELSVEVRSVRSEAKGREAHPDRQDTRTGARSNKTRASKSADARSRLPKETKTDRGKKEGISSAQLRKITARKIFGSDSESEELSRHSSDNESRSDCETLGSGNSSASQSSITHSIAQSNRSKSRSKLAKDSPSKTKRSGRSGGDGDGSDDSSSRSSTRSSRSDDSSSGSSSSSASTRRSDSSTSSTRSRGARKRSGGKRRESRKRQAAARVDRERMRRNFPAEGPPPTQQTLIEYRRRKEGFQVPALTGAVYRLRMKRAGAGKDLSVDILRGPKGCRHPKDCGMNNQLRYAIRRSRYEFAPWCDEVRSMLYDESLAEDLTDGYRSVALQHFLKFEKLAINRINIVVGEQGASCTFPIRKWAVLEHFIQFIWNRALAHQRLEWLWKDFDVIWSTKFEPMLHLVNGAPRQDIWVAMKFLGYQCSACNAEGFCDEFCGSCKRGVSSAAGVSTGSSTASPFTREQVDKAYTDWKSKQSAGAKTSKADFFAKNKQYAPIKASTKLNAENLSLTAAMDWLGKHEEIVREPRPGYF